MCVRRNSPPSSGRASSSRSVATRSPSVLSTMPPPAPFALTRADARSGNTGVAHHDDQVRPSPTPGRPHPLDLVHVGIRTLACPRTGAHASNVSTTVCQEVEGMSDRGLTRLAVGLLEGIG